MHACSPGCVHPRNIVRAVPSAGDGCGRHDGRLVPLPPPPASSRDGRSGTTHSQRLFSTPFQAMVSVKHRRVRSLVHCSHQTSGHESPTRRRKRAWFNICGCQEGGVPCSYTPLPPARCFRPPLVLGNRV